MDGDARCFRRAGAIRSKSRDIAPSQPICHLHCRWGPAYGISHTPRLQQCVTTPQFPGKDAVRSVGVEHGRRSVKRVTVVKCVASWVNWGVIDL